jgi:hypothetical protein
MKLQTRILILFSVFVVAVGRIIEYKQEPKPYEPPSRPELIGSPVRPDPDPDQTKMDFLDKNISGVDMSFGGNITIANTTNTSSVWAENVTSKELKMDGAWSEDIDFEKSTWKLQETLRLMVELR